MSNRPGIGGDFIWECASEWLKLGLDQSQPDVPSVLRHNKKMQPLGRYLKKRWRKAIGRDEKTPQVVLDEIKAGVYDVQKTAFDASESFAQALKKKNAQKTLNFERKREIYSKRKRGL